jgi:hypothetical protein
VFRSCTLGDTSVQLRIPEQTPSLKRPLISKIIEYSPSTLAKHSKNIEEKFRELLNEVLLSSNSDLQNRVRERESEIFSITDQ